MSKFLFRSYVALGDSLTEGLGDFDFHLTRSGAGWADRFANLLAARANRENENFKFANLALRGSSSIAILTGQLEDALKLEPDLVTIMAGANDFSATTHELENIKTLFRGALSRLLNQGAFVVLLTPINTRHLRVFTPYIPKAKRVSALVREMAAEYQVPVLNVFGISRLKNLSYWADDMVHFSGHGHIELANKMAEIIGLDADLRIASEPSHDQQSRSFYATCKWLIRDVVPFAWRALRGVTAGDFVEPKHTDYVQLNTRIKKPSFSRSA